MSVAKAQYEELLATYCSAEGVIGLLKQYRPYLEMLPSMRRPRKSLISIPLPVVKLRSQIKHDPNTYQMGELEAHRLPCDLALLMCDPEWKIKIGPEIFIFIHHPQEDFSDFLGRWRQTQVLLGRGYEWKMPRRYRHILSDGAGEDVYPLFVTFEETPERIRRGLKGACLPYVMQSVTAEVSPQEAATEDAAEADAAETSEAADNSAFWSGNPEDSFS